MKLNAHFPALTAAAVVLAAAAFTRVAQQPGFVGVVGNWRVIDDGGPAFKVDVTGWSGTTERSALEAHAKALFTTVNDTFLINGVSPQAFPLAVFSGVRNFTGGTLRVQFKMVGGATDQNAGIVFNLGANCEYYFVRYNTLDGNVAFWRYHNGARARVSMGTTHVQLPMNTWHELVLAVTGTRLRATVNGTVLAHEYTMPEPVSGRVGLWSKRDAITVFRNFQAMP
jgi:hypothetical protein